MEGLVSSLRALAERDMNLKEVTAALEMHAQTKGIAWDVVHGTRHAVRDAQPPGPP